MLPDNHPWGPGPVIPNQHYFPSGPGLVIPNHHFGPGPVENPGRFEGKVAWPPGASRLDVLTGCTLIKRSLDRDLYSSTFSLEINGSTGYLTATFMITVPWILSSVASVDRNWNRAIATDTLPDGHVNQGISPLPQGADTTASIVSPEYYDGKVTWPPAATAKDVASGCHTIATVLREHLYESDHKLSFDGSTGYTTATFKIWFYGIFKETGNIDKVWNLAVRADTVDDGHKNLGVVPEFIDDKTTDTAPSYYEGTVIWPPGAPEDDIKTGCEDITNALAKKWYDCSCTTSRDGSTGYTTARFYIRFNPPHMFMYNPYNDWNTAVAADPFNDGHQNKGLVPANNDAKQNGQVIPKVYEGKVAWPPTASQGDINQGCSTISNYLTDRSYECFHHMSYNSSSGYSTAKFIIRFHPAYTVVNNPSTDWNLAVAADTLKDGHVNEGLTLLIQSAKLNVLPPQYPMNTYEGEVVWPPTATKEDIKSGCNEIKVQLTEKSYVAKPRLTVDGSTGYTTARFLAIPNQAAGKDLATVTADWNAAVAADVLKDGHENKGIRQLETEGDVSAKKATNGVSGDAPKVEV